MVKYRNRPPPPGYERHPQDFNLIRRRRDGALHEYSPTTQSAERRRPPPSQPLARGLLPDATRGATSPLGGLAVPARTERK